MRRNETKYVLLELLSMAFLAASGIFVRYSVISPINAGMWRCLFALPVLYLMCRSELPALTKKDWLMLLAAGVMLAGDVALYNTAFSYTSVANATLIVNLTPFVIVPVSRFVFKESVPRHFLIGAAVAVAGLVLLMLGKAEGAESGFKGDLLSMAACVFYSAYILLTYRASGSASSSAIMFVCSISTTAVLFIIGALAEGPEVPRTWAEIWPILGMTLSLQVIGQNLLALCQHSLSVNLSSVICLSEPAFAAVYAILLFGEKPTVTELFGMAAVVIGVYLVKRQYDGD